MQRVEVEVACLETLSNFLPLYYMVLIIKKKQKHSQVSITKEDFSFK